LELKGNIVGTHWELGKNEKNPSSPPNLKRKKARHLDCMLGLSIGGMKFSFPKEFTIFCLG
jgi:hypothetical protein